MITIGSLFSGIGGIELGLERTGGFRTIWFVEKDPYCQAVLRKHWPNIPIYGDIKHINFGKLERPNMLTGGFPCQPISVAGKRKGKQDERWLWPNYAQAIRILRPKLVFVENVPNLASFNEEFGQILRDLASCGYDAEWQSVRASDVGAPHRRERIFIIAYSSKYSRNLRHELGSDRRQKETEQTGLGSENVVYPRCEGIQQRWLGGNVGSEGRRPSPMGRDELSKEQESESRTVADSASLRCNESSCTETEEGPTDERPEHKGKLQRRLEGCSHVSDSKKRGLEGAIAERTIFSERCFTEQAWRDWWAVEPDVGRVANGVPARVDRLKCLGNAVVPQVAEEIGRMILDWLS